MSTSRKNGAMKKREDAYTVVRPLRGRVFSNLFNKMWPFSLFADQATPSHYLHQQIVRKMTYLINRGAKVRKLSDNHVILEDLDDWNWQDAKKMNEISKYQLYFDVHSSFTANTDDIHGLVVSVSILPNSFLWSTFQRMTSVLTCVCFVMWGHCVFLQQPEL